MIDERRITKQAFNLNWLGDTVWLDCSGMVSASVRVVQYQGTWTTAVLTVVVDDGPNRTGGIAHPSTITPTSAAPATQVFSVVGYDRIGVRVTTAEGSDSYANVTITARASPA